MIETHIELRLWNELKLSGEGSISTCFSVKSRIGVKNRWKKCDVIEPTLEKYLAIFSMQKSDLLPVRSALQACEGSIIPCSHWWAPEVWMIDHLDLWGLKKDLRQNWHRVILTANTCIFRYKNGQIKLKPLNKTVVSPLGSTKCVGTWWHRAHSGSRTSHVRTADCNTAGTRRVNIELTYEGQQGISKCHARDQDSGWWPRISALVRETVNRCEL